MKFAQVFILQFTAYNLYVKKEALHYFNNARLLNKPGYIKF